MTSPTLITGYLLREAIRRWELRRDTASNQFEDSLTKFPGETKPDPNGLSAQFAHAEDVIAKLQTAQNRYNLAIEVEVLNGTMTLAEAVKRLGGAGRLEKMWRTAAGGSNKKDRYGYQSDTRQAGEIRAEKTVSVQVAMDNANRAAVFAGAIRAAIATGNGTQMPAEKIGLDPKWILE